MTEAEPYSSQERKMNIHRSRTYTGMQKHYVPTSFESENEWLIMRCRKQRTRAAAALAFPNHNCSLSDSRRPPGESQKLGSQRLEKSVKMGVHSDTKLLEGKVRDQRV